MKLYEKIEDERDRIQASLDKFGWTSDHNLDWYLDAILDSGDPVFAGFEDGSGLLTHRYENEWRIWSDPLTQRDKAPALIEEFSNEILRSEVEKVWCDDVSGDIRPALLGNKLISVAEVNYSLEWPVLNMEKYDITLPGGNFKEIRNAKNKFYKGHNLKIMEAQDCDKKLLYKIIDNWKDKVESNDEYNFKKYRNAIDNDFRGFSTSRVIIIDGNPIGINAGYQVTNNSNRFAGVVGIHDYSIKDLGLILWLEDFEWVKSKGYKEMDLQGDEGGGLKFKMQFRPFRTYKTFTFYLHKK